MNASHIVTHQLYWKSLRFCRFRSKHKPRLDRHNYKLAKEVRRNIHSCLYGMLFNAPAVSFIYERSGAVNKLRCKLSEFSLRVTWCFFRLFLMQICYANAGISLATTCHRRTHARWLRQRWSNIRLVTRPESVTRDRRATYEG